MCVFYNALAVDLRPEAAHTKHRMKQADIDEIDKLLEQKFARFFGKVTEHVDGRIDGLQTEMTDRFNRIATTLDGIANRLDTDDYERAAMNGQLDRHEGWIRQLAERTDTKLAPEQ